MEINQALLDLYQKYKSGNYFKERNTIKHWKKFIVENSISEYEELLNVYSEIQIFAILKTELPYSKTCPICGKELIEIYNWNDYNRFFFCSKECRESDSGKHYIINKKITTCQKNYGVDNPSQCKNIREKAENTNLKRFGVRHAAQNKEITQKALETRFKHHPKVIKPIDNRSIGERIRDTFQKKYNVDNYNQLPEAIERAQITTRSKTDWDNFVLKMKEKKLSVLSSKDDYIYNNIVKVKCDKCGLEFTESNPNKHGASAQYYFCPNRHHSGSKSEKEVLEYIKSLYNGTIISNSRKVLGNLELDIYIPEKKLAIEFDGVYWHSNINKPDNYHLSKTIACESQGIQLLHIFENEWEFKQDIVKDIIKAKLGCLSKRIFARKCVLGEVSKERYKKFMETYHIQGSINSSEIYGLYYDNELVEVCSFGKSRFKKGEMELLRHASVFDTIVIGGFSKIISYWKKLHPEETLISYVDRRYSNGKGYLSSGWTLDSISIPNYFYINRNERIWKLESRIKYQKHKLINILPEFDSNLTEKENMSKAGYFWIYDCGNLKFKI